MIRKLAFFHVWAEARNLALHIARASLASASIEIINCFLLFLWKSFALCTGEFIELLFGHGFFHPARRAFKAGFRLLAAFCC